MKISFKISNWITYNLQIASTTQYLHLSLLLRAIDFRKMTSPSGNVVFAGLIVRGSARSFVRSLARWIGWILRNLSSLSRRNFISLSRDGREKSCPCARAHARAFRNLLRGSFPEGSFAAEGSCGFCGSTRGERSLSSAASPDVLQLNPSKAARSVQRLPLPLLSPLPPVFLSLSLRYPSAFRRTPSFL